MDILFNVLGDGNKVDIRKIGKLDNTSDLSLEYSLWKSLAIKESSSKQFFIQKKEYDVINLFQLISYLLAVVNFVLGFHYLVGYLSVLLSIILLQYFYNVYKRTPEYDKQFYSWIAFSTYLSSIKSVDDIEEDKDLIILYSIILNKIDHVEKVLFNDNFLTNLNIVINNSFGKFSK